MQWIIENKEMVMGGLALIIAEVVTRLKPGWVPVSKWIYNAIGKAIPDKQK